MGKNFWPAYIIVAAALLAATWKFAPVVGEKIPAGGRASIRGLVAKCIREDTVLEQLPLDAFKAESELFAEDVYEAISLRTCVETRISEGGTSLASVKAQIAYAREKLA